MRAFFELLFDEQESTCFADTPKGTRVQGVTHFNPKTHAFFSINPLDPRKDRVPLESYHHPSKPRRADHNVTVFRNILIEMDKGPLTEQWAAITKIDLPFTSCVYSGGKSYHFIISLEEPCADRKSYDALVKRIYSVLGDRIDQACKNPSRLSRAPSYFREETGKYQNLNDLRARVSQSDLKAWLEQHGAWEEPEANDSPIAECSDSISISNLNLISPPNSSEVYQSTQRFLREGAPNGTWNNTLFKAACDAFAKGWSQNDFIERAGSITGHLDAKDLSTIRSAWTRARQKAG